MGHIPMTDPAHLSFDALNTALKAAGEDTRLRVLVLLAEAELTVSDLTQILRQSQPRISRHLRLLVEAGLIERFREGAWAFFRWPSGRRAPSSRRALVARLDPKDPIVARDRDRLAAVRRTRAAAAQDYFRAHAAQWDRIRKLHVADEAVEAAIRDALADGRSARCSISAPAPAASWKCSGRTSSAGSASTCRSTCCCWRAPASSARACAIAACARATSTISRCRRNSFDVVIIHQVLHFLDDGARAIREAARVLAPGGRLLVVDFAPHDLEFLREEHAHRRLGFAPETVAQWMSAAGPRRHAAQEPCRPSPAPTARSRCRSGSARDPRIQIARRA